MHRKVLATATLIVLALSFWNLSARAGAPKIYKVGDKIADFAFKDDKGKTHKLSQYKGKVIVLNFYASW